MDKKMSEQNRIMCLVATLMGVRRKCRDAKIQAHITMLLDRLAPKEVAMIEALEAKNGLPTLSFTEWLITAIKRNFGA